MTTERSSLCLEDVDHFHRLAILDRLLSEPRFIDRPEGPFVVDGRFFSDGRSFLALVVFEGGLVARVNDYVVSMNDDVLFQVEKHGNDRILKVLVAGKNEFSCRYLANDNDTFDEDPTVFIEDEDFDFGLFLSNVSRSATRKNVIIETLVR